jgi:hypothetical protein
MIALGHKVSDICNANVFKFVPSQCNANCFDTAGNMSHFFDVIHCDDVDWTGDTNERCDFKFPRFVYISLVEKIIVQDWTPHIRMGRRLESVDLVRRGSFVFSVRVFCARR